MGKNKLKQTDTQRWGIESDAKSREQNKKNNKNMRRILSPFVQAIAIS